MTTSWSQVKWMGFYTTFVHIKAKLGQENLLRTVKWMRWHCTPDTGFEIQALAAWGRARYLSVTEVPHNVDFLRVSGKETFVSLKLEGQSGVRTRDLRFSKQAAKGTAPPPPDLITYVLQSMYIIASLPGNGIKILKPIIVDFAPTGLQCVLWASGGAGVRRAAYLGGIL